MPIRQFDILVISGHWRGHHHVVEVVKPAVCNPIVSFIGADGTRGAPSRRALGAVRNFGPLRPADALALAVEVEAIDKAREESERLARVGQKEALDALLAERRA